MPKIEYKYLTPPEKKLCQEFGRFFKKEPKTIDRLEAFTTIVYKNAPNQMKRYITIKNDQLHTIGKIDRKGMSHDIVICQ